MRKTSTTDALQQLEELVGLIQAAGGAVLLRSQNYPVLIVRVDPAALPWNMRQLLQLLPGQLTE